MGRVDFLRSLSNGLSSLDRLSYEESPSSLAARSDLWRRDERVSRHEISAAAGPHLHSDYAATLAIRASHPTAPHMRHVRALSLTRILSERRILISFFAVFFALDFFAVFFALDLFACLFL